MIIHLASIDAFLFPQIKNKLFTYIYIYIYIYIYDYFEFIIISLL